MVGSPAILSVYTSPVDTPVSPCLRTPTTGACFSALQQAWSFSSINAALRRAIVSTSQPSEEIPSVCCLLGLQKVWASGAHGNYPAHASAFASWARFSVKPLALRSSPWGLLSGKPKLRLATGQQAERQYTWLQETRALEPACPGLRPDLLVTAICASSGKRCCDDTHLVVSGGIE